MKFYVVPKADQYEIGGSIYIQIPLPAEAAIVTFCSKGAPAEPQDFFLRDIQLTQRGLGAIRPGALRTIAKYTLNYNGNMNKKELIAFILSHMRLEE